MKEKKFVPYEKLSKKKKKELDKMSRTLWAIDPTTRCEKLGYKRHKEKDRMRKQGFDD